MQGPGLTVDHAVQIIMFAHQPTASREQRLAASELFTQVPDCASNTFSNALPYDSICGATINIFIREISRDNIKRDISHESFWLSRFGYPKPHTSLSRWP